MIRNVVIHVSNEQPLLADLHDLPTAADAGLVCTNLRTMDGKRPIFIDRSESFFFFPYLVIRFLEIPPKALDEHRAEGGSGVPVRAATAAEPAPVPPAMAQPAAATRVTETLPVPLPAPAEDTFEVELDVDTDFLRRVRDI